MCYQDAAVPIRLRSHPPTPDLDRNAHVTTGISVPLLSRTRLFLLLLLDCSVIHSLSYSCSPSSFTIRSVSSSTPPPLSPAAAQLSRLSPGVSFKHGTCTEGKMPCGNNYTSTLVVQNSTQYIILILLVNLPNSRNPSTKSPLQWCF